MNHDLAFLHTSPLHVSTFGAIVEGLAPRLRVRHDVAEDLLAAVRHPGADHPALSMRVQQAMLEAALSGAAVVVCSCSTVGGAARCRAARS